MPWHEPFAMGNAARSENATDQYLPQTGALSHIGSGNP
jgi:hypothetical protein